MSASSLQLSAVADSKKRTGTGGRFGQKLHLMRSILGYPMPVDFSFEIGLCKYAQAMGDAWWLSEQEFEKMLAMRDKIHWFIDVPSTEAREPWVDKRLSYRGLGDELPPGVDRWPDEEQMAELTSNMKLDEEQEWISQVVIPFMQRGEDYAMPETPYHDEKQNNGMQEKEISQTRKPAFLREPQKMALLAKQAQSPALKKQGEIVYLPKEISGIYTVSELTAYMEVLIEHIVQFSTKNLGVDFQLYFRNNTHLSIVGYRAQKRFDFIDINQEFPSILMDASHNAKTVAAQLTDRLRKIFYDQMEYHVSMYSAFITHFVCKKENQAQVESFIHFLTSDHSFNVLHAVTTERARRYTSRYLGWARLAAETYDIKLLKKIVCAGRSQEICEIHTGKSGGIDETFDPDMVAVSLAGMTSSAFIMAQNGFLEGLKLYAYLSGKIRGVYLVNFNMVCNGVPLVVMVAQNNQLDVMEFLISLRTPTRELRVSFNAITQDKISNAGREKLASLKKKLEEAIKKKLEETTDSDLAAKIGQEIVAVTKETTIARMGGISALYMAAQRGFVAMVKLLLSIRDVKKNTPEELVKKQLGIVVPDQDEFVVDTNQVSFTEDTALSAAVKNGHIAVVKVLLEAENLDNTGYRTLVSSHSSIAESSVHVDKGIMNNFSSHSSIEESSVHVDKGTVNNFSQPHSEKKVLKTAKTTPILRAVEYNQLEILMLLILAVDEFSPTKKPRADIDVARERDGATALHVAVAAGNLSAVKILCEENEEKICRSRDIMDANLTLNDQSAKSNADNMGQALREGFLEIYSDVDLYQATPVHLAAIYDEEEKDENSILQVLINAKRLAISATVLPITQTSRFTVSGSSATFLPMPQAPRSAFFGNRGSGNTNLLFGQNSLGALLDPLITQMYTAELDLEMPDNGLTPLYCAVMKGNVVAVKRLLQARELNHDWIVRKTTGDPSRDDAPPYRVQADRQFASRGYKTVLMTAAIEADDNILQLLIDSKRVDVNKQCHGGFTAAHYAAGSDKVFDSKESHSVNQRRMNMLKMLALNGANFTLKNKAGKTPFDIARESKQPAVLDCVSACVGYTRLIAGIQQVAPANQAELLERLKKEFSEDHTFLVKEENLQAKWAGLGLSGDVPVVKVVEPATVSVTAVSSSLFSSASSSAAAAAHAAQPSSSSFIFSTH